MRAKVVHLLSFGLAGAIGFIVDSGGLALLIGPLGPYFGRLCSFLAAVVTTWLVNRNFAFADRTRRHSLLGEFGRYLASMLVGGVLNFGVYSGVVAMLGHDGLMPYLGLAAGTGVGMVANYCLAHFVVFKPTKS